jgi:hypothetical protein
MKMWGEDQEEREKKKKREGEWGGLKLSVGNIRIFTGEVFNRAH